MGEIRVGLRMVGGTCSAGIVVYLGVYVIQLTAQGQDGKAEQSNALIAGDAPRAVNHMR